LISASRDKQIRIWEVITGHCIVTLSGHQEWVKHLSVSPKGAHLASCSRDQSIIIWDIQNLKSGGQATEKWNN